MNFKTPPMLPRKKRPNIVTKRFEITEQEKISPIVVDFDKALNAEENGLTPFSSYKITDNSITLEREYVEGKSLNEILVDKTRLTTTEVHQLAMSIMSIVYRLHSFGITLNNIKPSNIIILSTGEVTFVDCAYDIIYMENLINTTDPLTVLFAGPEKYTISDSSNSEKHDIWCLGLVIYYMFFGTYPIDTSSIDSVNDQLSNLRNNFQYPPEIDPEFKDLLTSMLNRDPEKRLSSLDVLQTLSGITVPDKFYNPFIFKRSNSFGHNNDIHKESDYLRNLKKDNRHKRVLKGKTICSISNVDIEAKLLQAKIQEKVGKRPNSLSYSDLANLGYETF